MKNSAGGTRKKVNADTESQRYYLLYQNLNSGFAFHELIFDDNGVPIDFRYIDINNKYKEIWGVDDSIIGKTVNEAFPNYTPEWMSGPIEVLKTGGSVVKTIYLENSGKNIELTIYKIDNSHFAGIFNDITERVRMEKENSDKTAWFRKILDNLPIAICTINLAGEIKYLNKAFYDCFEYAPGEISNLKTWTESAFPDLEKRKVVLEMTRTDLEELKAGKKSFSTTRVFTVRSGKGRNLDVEITFTFLGDEAFVIFRDITEKSNAERLIANERNMLRLLIDTIPGPVYVKDTKSRFLVANKSLGDLLNMKPEDMIGLSDELLFPPEYFTGYLNDEINLLKTGIPVINKEERVPDKNQNVIIVQTTKLPLRNPEGEIIGLVGSGHIITEQKKFEEALKKRVLALTKPLDDPEGIRFTDLFNLEDLQKLQDTFANATGVASIITTPEGTPITNPSNFTEYCKIVRNTEKGINNCYQSDSVLGRQHIDRPILSKCLSGGLWDGGTSINIGGKHLANWLIGQVRNELTTEEDIFKTADEIGIDRSALIEAFYKVPVMSKEKFEEVCTFLFNIVSELSLKAYQNVQQARFIFEQKQAEDALKISEAKYRNITQNIPGLVFQCGLDENDELKFFYISDRAIDFLGVSSKNLDAILESFMKRISDPDKESFIRSVNEALRTNEPWKWEGRFTMPDGKEIIIHGIAQGRPVNNRMIYDGIVFDITEQKKAEEKIRELAGLQQTILSTITAGLTFIKNSRQVWVNSYMSKIFGYNLNELSDSDASILFFSKEDHQHTINESKEQLIKGGVYQKEIQLKRKDGTGVWISLAVKALNPEELNEGTIWMFLDITERKRDEEIIIKNQKFLNDSQRVAHIGCWEYYFDEDLMVWNDEAYKIYGFNKTEVIPNFNSFLGALYPDDRPFALEHLKLCKTENIFKDFECHIITPDGIPKTILIVGAFEFDENGKAYKSFGIIQDITEKKANELVMKAQDAKLQSIYRAAPVGIGLTENRIFHECNDEFYSMTGYTPDEILGHDARMLYISDEDYDIMGKIQTGFISEEPLRTTETKWRQKSGKIINVLLSFLSVDNSDFSKGFVFSAQDITSRKKAEDDIIKLNAELEKRVNERTLQLQQANRDLEAFAYSVSHDLRAPIRHIDGFVKLMYSKITNHSDSIANYYSKIELASQKMSSMIDSLLSFSRLGRKELSLTLINMQVLIQEIIEEISPDLEKRKIKWNIEPLPDIKCDRSLMKLVFENLISNAVKYTSKVKTARIDIGWRPLNSEQVEIFVKDNGAGFDMAYANKLFGVFQRLHSNEEFEGIGIGLANVRQIIEKHNGSVRAEGKPDEGAIFYVTLPK
jgi:PAS domain S-box-containing protein